AAFKAMLGKAGWFLSQAFASSKLTLQHEFVFAIVVRRTIFNVKYRSYSTCNLLRNGWSAQLFMHNGSTKTYISMGFDKEAEVVALLSNRVSLFTAHPPRFDSPYGSPS